LTRDDRELIRLRLAVAQDCGAIQNRVRWLLKRNGIEAAPAKGWTEAYWQWLEQLSNNGRLRPGASGTLASLMRQIQGVRAEIERLDAQVLALSRAPRFAPVVAALRRHKGAGILTAMVYLTEMGDLSRFANRQQVGSYLGLTPSSFESGQDSDHKGHITHQGPSRVRKVLCQAVWSRLRSEPGERFAYDRIVAKNPKHKKIAVVARMRIMGIALWHHGLEAQQALKAPPEPRGSGREKCQEFFEPNGPPDPYGPPRCLGGECRPPRRNPPAMKGAKISN
jgi:transposase